jgi:hypothetical protein
MSRKSFSLIATALLLPAMFALADDTKAPAKVSSEKMTPQTRLMVIRDLSSERVFARCMFPMGTKGLQIKNGVVTPSERQITQLIAENGLAARVGDRVVISNVVVKPNAIVLEINGGPRKKQKWYQHIEVGANNVGGPVGGAPKDLEAKGSLVTIEFDKYVPELTGDQVRDMLSPVFDFKALNQAEAYAKTLPPIVQEAIKNHKVLVGMDRDMVIYAKGRPPKKIRDKDDKGQDYEEWIYGEPPQEVEFVRFQGAVVARLEIMQVGGEKIVRTEKEVELPAASTEVAEKKPAAKPANAPSLRRPGEQEVYPQDPGVQTGPSTQYPTPGSGRPEPVPTDPAPPPHWIPSS